MTVNVALFVLAALFEIAGCFAFWLWLRRGQSGVIALLGILSLCGFALVLTRLVAHVDDGDQLANPLPLTTYAVCPACQCETAVAAYRHLDEVRCFCPGCEYVWDALASDS